MPKEESLPTRKKMRKGTHSCFECRRRKIRCIFPVDNPNVCSECFARGSRCIDQEHADPDVVVDHRKNLRERVSRLEALVDSLLEDKTEKSTISDTASSKTPPQFVTDKLFPPTPVSTEASSSFLQNAQRAPSDRGHHVPILSVFEEALNDAEERIKARMEPFRKESFPKATTPDDRYTLAYTNVNDIMGDGSLSAQAKKERTKQALLGVLPPYEKLNKILNSNSEWWQTWRRKCSGTSGSEQTLAQFAAKALAEGNIGAIGTVVLSVGICSDDERDVERYMETIDRYVLSDDEYAATLEGMECLILKAKWYADVGQPRRAWLAYRKGLMYTQLMGLHRKRTSSAAHESIWWSLYHGDRFLSLLLGLPYGISDTHCDLSLPDMPQTGPYLAPLVFMNKVSILAGKVIDRNQGIAEQSFAWALQLDQELEELWNRLDPAWLEYADLLADIESNAAELREKIMAQMIYHQIRVYLHLPFMLKSQTNSRFTYSRTACLNGSREVLRLYQALRTGEVQPLYECKAIDFIGFTSAVLIVLGLFNYGGTNTSISPKEKEADVRLIEISIDIFQRASSEKGGKVALQSAEVLDKMLKKFKAEMEHGANVGAQDPCSHEMTEFVIPYFGTISIKRGGKTLTPQEFHAQKKVAMRTASLASQQSQQSQLTPGSDTTSTSADLFSAHSRLTPTTTNTTTNQTTSSDPFSFNPAASTGSASADPSPFVSYDGFYNWGNIGADNDATSTVGTQINDDSMNNFPLPTNNFSWQNMPMDIDQDWSWFLNDGGNVGGQAQGEASGANAGIGTDFTQQGFVGFG